MRSTLLLQQALYLLHLLTQRLDKLALRDLQAARNARGAKPFRLLQVGRTDAGSEAQSEEGELNRGIHSLLYLQHSISFHRHPLN